MPVRALPAIQRPRDSPPVPGRLGTARFSENRSGTRAVREAMSGGRFGKGRVKSACEVSGCPAPEPAGAKPGECLGRYGRGFFGRRVPYPAPMGSRGARSMSGPAPRTTSRPMSTGPSPAAVPAPRQRGLVPGSPRPPFSSRIAVLPSSPASSALPPYPFSRPSPLSPGPVMDPGRYALFLVRPPVPPRNRSWPGGGRITAPQDPPGAPNGRAPPHWTAHGPVRAEPTLPGTEFGRPREDDRPLAQQETDPPEKRRPIGGAARRIIFRRRGSARGRRRKVISGRVPRPSRQPRACPCAPRPSTRLASHS